MKFGEKLASVEAYTPFPYAGQIRLDANESGYELPEDIRKKMLEAVAAVDFNRYPDPDAIKLCRAFASYYSVAPETVVAGNGSDELLSVIFGGVLGEKDRVLVLQPDFSMYRIYCETYGRKVDVFSKEEDLTFDADAVCRYIQEHQISFFIFSNPCNPTGLQVSESDLCRLLENTDCTVCVDEAYMDFSSGSLLSEINRYPNLIILKTMSKNIGFAAGRVGFAVSAAENIAAIKKAKSPYNLNSLSQAAAAVLFENGAYLQKISETIVDGRKQLESSLQVFSGSDFQIYSSNANFVYIKTEKASAYYQALLERNIVIRCLNGQYLRITAGTAEENRQLLRALKQIIQQGKEAVLE